MSVTRALAAPTSQMLQTAEPSRITSVVDSALRSPGFSIDPAACASLEASLGHLFGKISIRPASAPSGAGLRIGSPADRAELEADAKAARAMTEDAGPSAHRYADFSAVRVHTGPQASASAALLGALAYAVGTHIVFGPGQYAPQTKRGQQVLAHELTHVVQQEQSTLPPVLRRIGVLESLARFFGGGTFEVTELQAYLEYARPDA